MGTELSKYLPRHQLMGLIFAFTAVSITILLFILEASDVFGLWFSGMWTMLTYIPFTVEVLITGDISLRIGVYFYIATSIQWYIIGYAVSVFYSIIRNNKGKSN